MFVPGPDEKPLFLAEPITIEDLNLLAELFYLPYEHGNKAVQMLREFNWLRANSSVVSVNCKRKETEKVGWLGEKKKTAVKTFKFIINTCLWYMVAGNKMVDVYYQFCPLGGAVWKKVVLVIV